MRGRDIHAEAAEMKQAITNVRGWLDNIEARVDRLLESFAPAPEQREQPYDPAQGLARSYGADGGGTPASEMGAQPSVQFDGDPVAQSVNTLVTPKQLGMMRALARECGVDYEIECQEQLNCKPEDLGKRAASAFIDYLKALQEHGAAFQKVS